MACISIDHLPGLFDNSAERSVGPQGQRRLSNVCRVHQAPGHRKEVTLYRPSLRVFHGFSSNRSAGYCVRNSRPSNGEIANSVSRSVPTMFHVFFSRSLNRNAPRYLSFALFSADPAQAPAASPRNSHPFLAVQSQRETSSLAHP